MAISDLASAHRFVLTHRRLLAAGFAGLAMLFILGAIRPSDTGLHVIVASRDLPSGTVLAATDLRNTTVQSKNRPAHAIGSTEQVLGQRIAAPMRRGEALTDYRLLGPSLLRGHTKGLVIATVRIADSPQLASLRVGDHINVVATDPDGDQASTVIARGAEVVSLPRTRSDNDTPTVVVAVTETVGLQLARVGLRARLSVLAVS